MITFLGCVLSYPTLYFWVSSPETIHGLDEDERRLLLRRAAVPGVDLAGGYRFSVEAESGRLTERGQENLMTMLAAVLRARIKGIGIMEAVVRAEDENRLLVEVPANVDTMLVRHLLEHSGAFSYHLFKEGTEVQKLRERIDAGLQNRHAADTLAVPGSQAETLSGYLASLTTGTGIEDIVVAETSVSKVQALLADTTVLRTVRAFNLANPPSGIFVWASAPVEQNGIAYRPLYFVNQEADLPGQPILSATVTELAAESPFADRARYGIRITLSEENRADLANVSSANVGDRLAILMNRQAHMTMPIQGRISDGRTEMPGGKTLDEARHLAVALETGLLPGRIQVSAATPLTAEASGVSGLIVWAAAVAAAGIVLVAVYRSAGLVAGFGFVYQMLMAIAVLRLWNIAGFLPLITLSTLAGLGLSFVLTTGMHAMLLDRIKTLSNDTMSAKTTITDAMESVRPVTLWLHGILACIALVFVAAGTGVLSNVGIGLFSGVSASLITLSIPTRLLLISAITRQYLAR